MSHASADSRTPFRGSISISLFFSIPALLLLGVLGVSASEIPFGARRALDSMPGSWDIHATDLDGDGDLDMVVAATLEDSILWLENTDGRGSAWLRHTIGQLFLAPFGVDAVDIDGDGDLDVAAAGQVQDQVAWWENVDSRAGTWRKHLVSAKADGASAVRAADFDRDGDQDLVGAVRYDHQIVWWENVASDGTDWTSRTVVGGFGDAISVQVADMDLDGDADAIGASFATGVVGWWENVEGDRHNWPGHAIDNAIDSSAGALCVADVDGDGDPDVVGTAAHSDWVAWWENMDASGTSWTRRTIDAGVGFPSSVESLDFDGDGDLDVLGAAYYGNSVLWCENADGRGGDWKKYDIDNAFSWARDAVAADFDGDGDPDVAAVAALNRPPSLWINESIHRRALFPATSYEETLPSAAIVLGDMDNDGDLDRAQGDKWYENANGLGTSWRLEEDFRGDIVGERSSQMLVDMDGDGDLDMLGVAGGSLAGMAALVWEENPNREGGVHFEHPIRVDIVIDGSMVEVEPVSAVDAADIDGDGDMDVLATLHDSGILYWCEQTTTEPANLQGLHYVAVHLDAPFCARLVDLDRDGDQDVVATVRGETALGWWENTEGSGRAWVPHTINQFQGFAEEIHVADIDKDGAPDIVGVSAERGFLAWWRNELGNATTWNARFIEEGLASARSLCVGDLDRDGDVDLLAVGGADDAMAWWENLDGAASSWRKHTVATGMTEARIGDLDRDGDPDIIASDSNRTYVWPNQGGQFGIAGRTVAPASIRERESDALLRFELTHLGKPGDADLELGTLEIQFADTEGNPLSDEEARALAAGLQVFADDGSGLFESEADPAVVTVDSNAFTSGSVRLTAPSNGDLGAVAQGESRTFFIAAQLTTMAVAQAPNAFRIALAPNASGTAPSAIAVHRARGIPLWGEALASVVSSVVQATINFPLPPVMLPEPPFTEGSENMIEWLRSYSASDYRIEASRDPDFAGADDAADLADSNPSSKDALTHTFVDLEVDQAYWYRVRAENAVGPSAWSAATSSTQGFPHTAWDTANWLPDLGLTTSGLLLPGPYDVSDTLGVGFDVTGLVPRARVYYSKWYMADEDGNMFLIPHDGEGVPNPLFEAVATLRSTAPEAHLTPGYRLLYANGAYTHVGGLTVATPEPTDGASVNAPSAQSDFEARVFWAVPSDLTADDYMNQAQPGFYDDGRDYTIMFDLVHSEAGDTGLLTVESLTIRVHEALAPRAPAIEWDGASGAFADWYAGYYAHETNEGTFRIVGAGEALRLSAANAVSRGYELTHVSATPPHPLAGMAADPVLAFEGERLLRLNLDVRSLAPDRSPVFRVITLSQNGQGGPRRPMVWMDVFGSSVPFVKRPAARQPGQLAPGVPRAEGSNVAAYVWTHGQAGNAAQAGDYVLPQIDVYSADLYGRHAGEAFWPDDTGVLEFSRVAIERLGAP